MPAQLEEWFEHKVHTITQFLNARNVFAAEIHYQQVEIYGEDVMSWHSLTKQCIHFQTGTVMEDLFKKKKKVADTQQQTLNTSGLLWEVQFAVRWITRC